MGQDPTRCKRAREYRYYGIPDTGKPVAVCLPMAAAGLPSDARSNAAAASEKQKRRAETIATVMRPPQCRGLPTTPPPRRRVVVATCNFKDSPCSDQMRWFSNCKEDRDLRGIFTKVSPLFPTPVARKSATHCSTKKNANPKVGVVLDAWRPHGDSNPGTYRERVMS